MREIDARAFALLHEDPIEGSPLLPQGLRTSRKKTARRTKQASRHRGQAGIALPSTINVTHTLPVVLDIGKFISVILSFKRCRVASLLSLKTENVLVPSSRGIRDAHEN